MPKDETINANANAKDSKKDLKKDTKKDNKKTKPVSESDSDESSDVLNNFEEELDEVQEYRKFLAKTFPSKMMNKKVKNGEKLQKLLKNNKGKKIEDEEDNKDENNEDENNKYEEKPVKKSKKPVIPESESDSETLGSEDSETESESESKPIQKGKFNIILSVGPKMKYNDYDDEDEDYDDDDDEWESYSESETENEDDPISDSSVSSDEEDEKQEDEEDDKHEKQEKPSKKRNKKTEKEPEIKKVEQETPQNNDISNTMNYLAELKEDLKNGNGDQDHVLLLEELQELCKKREKEIAEKKKKEQAEANKKKEKVERKTKERNHRIFRRILRDKNMMNDLDFYDKFDTEKQNRLIKELREINNHIRVEKPYRLTLLESDMPVEFKAAAMKRISSLRNIQPGESEYFKLKNWVDTFMRIPFGKYNNLPIKMSDGVDKCHDFMETAKQTLDTAVYGLNDAKMQIMQMLGQLITNPLAIGTAIAIHGPPGTGKTSLVKEGISKILNRPFAFIALGGATDSSFLEGHSYTYEGSTWGKIVQILIDSKCMNPVIYFDELDKISDTPKGEEIAGILTHLTDTSQNSQFHDKYFSDVNFDLSKCLFIFSYNDETKINPILKDRMYRIQTKGYNQKQKTTIANSYLLPKIREQVSFKQDEIVIPDQTLQYIIDSYCNKEDGVRNLKRCLEIVHTKLNLYRLMRPDSNLFEEDMSLKVEFPFTVTKDVIDKLIKKNEQNVSLYMLYC